MFYFLVKLFYKLFGDPSHKCLFLYHTSMVNGNDGVRYVALTCMLLYVLSQPWFPPEQYDVESLQNSHTHD